MRESTTDGRVIDTPDFCPYCDMDTAGNHEAGCPLQNSQEFEVIQNIH